MDWKLSMELIGPYGERMTASIPLSHTVAREVHTVDPPHAFDFVQGETAVDTAVKAIKRREFRKDLFVNEAKRLGGLLAERMEDAEGWHDESRVEPAKRSLNQRA